MLENYELKYLQDLERYRNVKGITFGNQVKEVLRVIRNDEKVYKDYVSWEAIQAGTKLCENFSELWPEVAEKIVDCIMEEVPFTCPHVTVWWYSVCLALCCEEKLFQEFVFYVRKNKDAFSANTQHFLFYQMKSMYFRFKQLENADTREEIWLYFKEVIDAFTSKMTTSLEPLSAEERNPEKILVITEQYLAIQHGPTKTALDRCKILMENMGKEVLLLNTMECMTRVGAIPFYNAAQANCIEELMWQKSQTWKGTEVPYFQCGNNMPDIEELDGLLSAIREEAPAYIVSIGDTSVLANLANKMVPAICVGLAPSELGYTTLKYQTVSRKLTDRDKQMLTAVGFDESHVMESIFTSGLKLQTETVGRADYGISAEKFIMVVVGARLDDEVTDEFLQMIEGILREDMVIAFLGIFRNYEMTLSRFPELKKQCINLGYCNDILSRMEICDLYINPTRKGGGTSCVEAMFKGIPVVSVNFGDVSVNVGEDFCVEDYRQMQERILKHYEDREYHEEMAKKASKRAEILLDTESEFVRIMREIDAREKENGLWGMN